MDFNSMKKGINNGKANGNKVIINGINERSDKENKGKYLSMFSSVVCVQCTFDSLGTIENHFWCKKFFIIPF